MTRTSEWWRTSAYTQVQRYRAIRFLSRLTGLRIPYRETTYDNYFRKTKGWSQEIIRLIRRNGIELRTGARVLEPGCNVGRNLYYLRRAFGIEPYGIDISADAIGILRERVLPNVGTFTVGDVFRSDWLAQFPDKHFDLVLTCGFLQHLPGGPDKVTLIHTLLRLGRTVMFVELWKPERAGEERTEAGGTYHLSFEDYSAYGMRVIPSAFFDQAHISDRVYLR